MDISPISVEYIPQPNGYEGILQHIESAARTCYKSEDRQTPDSAAAFVEKLIERGHLSPLEHATVYLHYKSNDRGDYVKFNELYKEYQHRHHCRVGIKSNHLFITTNYRNIVERQREQDLEYLENTGMPERMSFRIVADRATIDELCRHRCASFSVESTRYCDYSKDRHGSQLTFVLPADFRTWSDIASNHFLDNLQYCERRYMEARADGLSPQQARALLPLCTKSEMVMTAYADDWAGILRQRLSTAAHPTVRKVAQMIADHIEIQHPGIVELWKQSSTPKE